MSRYGSRRKVCTFSGLCLHGPLVKWDYNCIISISLSYRELHLTGTAADWDFRIPLESPGYWEYCTRFFL